MKTKYAIRARIRGIAWCMVDIVLQVVLSFVSLFRKDPEIELDEHEKRLS